MKFNYEKLFNHHLKVVITNKRDTCHFVPCKNDNDIRNYAQEAIESETETASAAALIDYLRPPNSGSRA